ncbi:hypothetical protein A9Q81_27330 [Gammaproteobacteria bacterium 42_54_T18]|nr:hypothetical protein A9Q81_27330 [Gammaproteobacteria bacterium 42_54_T18]
MLVRWSVSVLLVVLISGCAFKNNPTPLGDSELVGQWLHERESALDNGTVITRMALDITQEGYISYHFMSCFSSKGDTRKNKTLHLLNMPMIRVTTKKIKAQTFPLTPKWEFKINEWPTQENNQWQMTVDNMLLAKIDVSEDVGAKVDGWRCE